MTTQLRSRIASRPVIVTALLVIVMAATRINHFAIVPDASWAIFFVGGFYLNRWRRVLFPLLIIEAVLIDYLVISGQGLNFWNHYCVSAAYWFLLPAFFSLWFGGARLARVQSGLNLRSAGLLALGVVIATSACFLISNGSFYWLSANVPARSFGGWMSNMGDWYFAYLVTTCMYVGVAALAHALTLSARGTNERRHRLASR